LNVVQIYLLNSARQKKVRKSGSFIAIILRFLKPSKLTELQFKEGRLNYEVKIKFKKYFDK